MLKLKPAINTAYKRKICMYWTKKLSVSIVKAVCCISSGMGGDYKENVSSPKNVFVTKESIVDRKWYPLMVWWYTKQTIKNMRIYT